jgi:tRNA (cytidine/uridine-2'-O-)-methyltransferase
MPQARAAFPFAPAVLKAKAMISPAPPLWLALYEPDIAQNTGAMLRTCACFGIRAAIIEPAGFPVSDRHFRRSGMDYLDHVAIERHISWQAFSQWRRANGKRLVLLTTKAEISLWDFSFRPEDVIMVGRESAGVPQDVHDEADARVRIAIQPTMRSLNVGVAAALALGEALRQIARSAEATG